MPRRRPGGLLVLKGAEFSGYSRRAFMELLDRYEVPVFDHPFEEPGGKIEGLCPGSGHGRDFTALEQIL
jgi:hypothetical protein